jgi:hypothetical protein
MVVCAIEGHSWARSAASSAIATDIVRFGYMVTLDEGLYTVKLPKGMKRPLIKGPIAPVPLRPHAA